QLVGGELLRGADRLVDRGQDHVLKELGVGGIDRLGIDRQLQEPQIAAHLDLHHPAAGARLDHLVLELFLGLHHLALPLPHLLHHRVQIQPSGPASRHAAPSSSVSNSSASNSDFSRSINSSSLSCSSSSREPASCSP